MAVNKKRAVSLPLSVLVEPEGFGERDFFAEADNEQANDELEGDYFPTDEELLEHQEQYEFMNRK